MQDFHRKKANAYLGVRLGNPLAKLITDNQGSVNPTVLVYAHAHADTHHHLAHTQE